MSPEPGRHDHPGADAPRCASAVDRCARGRPPGRGPSGTQGSVTFTCRPPRSSTRCIIEPPSACGPACHLTLLVAYHTPSGTWVKEKLPEESQRVVRRLET